SGRETTPTHRPATRLMSGPEARLDASGSPERFRTTRWSLVLAARDRTSPEARQALQELCEAYWYPLYAFIRRCGHPAEDAQDLTQEFFVRLLEKDFLPWWASPGASSARS